jgi:F-type H+-transporting ATPase subunit delta|tara:strand:- start:63 stop:626 length:564 start_codon:yes stop_codon:yes gene_type:complete
MAQNIAATKIANPYAQALLDLAKSKNLIHTITSDINNLRELLNSTKEFKNYLSSPIVRNDSKRELIEKTINSQISPEMSRFLMILIDRNRISHIEVIAERYLELVYELANIKIVEVTSANELTEEQQQNLIIKLKEMTNAKEIKLLLTIDASLLGGFLIKSNSQVIDLTIKGQLTDLAKHLDSVLEI